ncbi:MAG TPA: LPS assembly lipoprotein LptE [Syntrophorhabdales bacterium]|nr:LPS assembly lipoprotein LptE [Syntrophorhabdales bacterium]
MRLLTLFFLFLILPSCGFTIVREKGIFQGEVVSLDVPVFKNQTLEPQLPQFFTEAFSRELVASGLFDINKAGASSTLQGTIAAIRTVPAAFDQNGLTIQKTVYVTLGLALSRKDGRPIKSWGLSDAEPYNVNDINLEDSNMKQALIRIAARMARRFSALVIADIDRKAL